MTGNPNDTMSRQQVLTAMIDDGVDPRDSEAVRTWLRRPYGQEARGSGVAGRAVPTRSVRPPTESPVRPVRLKSETELAALAEACPTLAGLRGLADWAERHRPSWGAGGPGSAAARAAREHAVFGPSPSGAEPAAEATRSWRAAFDAGLVTAVSGQVRRVSGKPDPGPDPLVLRRWLAVYAVIVDFGEHCEGAEHDGWHLAERVLGELMFELYQRGRKVPWQDGALRLATGIIDDAVMDGVVSAERRTALRGFAEEAVHAALAQLVRHGAVTRFPGGEVQIAPLGLWGLNRMLNEAGLRAPVLGGHTRADADTLITVLSGYSESERAMELLEWLGERTADEAAAELLAAAAKADTGRRGMAVAILNRIGPEAERAVRAGLRDPVLWRHCKQWLDGRGFDSERALSDADRAWLLAESVVGLSGQRGPQDYVRMLGRCVGEQEIPLVALLADLDHPDRVRALDLLFELHPDPKVAVAAQRR